MPGPIPENILDQVRQSNDIVEVIGAYFPLKRKGAGFWALCPFHKEKSPSFQVNQQKQIWHCFGCGAGGNVFTFVMKYENLDFVAVVRRLAERAHITLEFEEAPGAPTRDQRELLFKLHEQATEFFHRLLMKEPAADPARQYLRKRELSADTAKRWRIGYAPEAWDALIRWGQERKFAPDLLEAAGLVVRGDRGPYDRFRGRLMFPIADEQGRVVAFSGRILTEAKDQAKYVNSPETPIFQKGKILFALDKAKRAILDAKFAVICEGQVDTISCHEAGLANVVAPQGTALTEQHARILKRYADEVVLMFDADAAGQNATVRNAEPLWETGFVMRVVVLPEGHDPDSFLKQHGPDKLREMVSRAPAFLDFLLARLSSQFDARTDRGKLQIAEQIVGWLCRIRSPILQASYTQRTAAHHGLDESAIRAEMKRFTARGSKPPAPSDEAPTDAPAERPKAHAAEELLLQLMLADERVIRTTVSRLDRAWLSDSLAGELIARVLDLAENKQWTGPESLLNASQDEGVNRFLSRLLITPTPPADRFDRWTTECLETLERQRAKRESRTVRKPHGENELTASDIDKLKRIETLARKIHAPKPNPDPKSSPPTPGA